MDQPGRSFDASHARWRLRHIAEARRQVEERFTARVGDLTRRLEELDRETAACAAQSRLYELLAPRLRLDYRLDEERVRLTEVVRAASAGRRSERGQDFLHRVRALVSGD